MIIIHRIGNDSKILKSHEKISLNINFLFNAKMHVGFLKSRWFEYSKSFIAYKKNNIYLINIIKTFFNLKMTLNFLTNLSIKRGKIILIDQRKIFKRVIKTFSFFLNRKLKFIDIEWVSGYFSNYYKLASQKQHKKVYGKKRYRYKMRLPQVAVIYNCYTANLAFTELKRMGVPLIALVNTDLNGSRVNFYLGSNDSSVFVSILLSALISLSICLGYVIQRSTFFFFLKRFYFFKFLKKFFYVSKSFR
jgi:small subunit ribosomal protein S2